MMVAVRHAQAGAVRCIVDHAPRHLGANPTFNRYCILRHACEQGNSDIVRWYCNPVLPAAYRGEWGDLSQDVKSAIANALCIAVEAVDDSGPQSRAAARDVNGVDDAVGHR